MCGELSCPGCGKIDPLLESVVESALRGSKYFTPVRSVFVGVDERIFGRSRAKCNGKKSYDRYWDFYSLLGCGNSGCGYRYPEVMFRGWKHPVTAVQAEREADRRRADEAKRRREFRKKAQQNQVEYVDDLYHWKQKQKERQKQKEKEIEKIARFVYGQQSDSS